MKLHAAVFAVVIAAQLLAGAQATTAAATTAPAAARPRRLACLGRRLLQRQSGKWDSKKDTREAIASAYSPQKGSAVAAVRGPRVGYVLPRFMQESASTQNRVYNKTTDRETIANAYASQKGSDPTGPGDAFNWDSAEASSTASYNGVYYNDGGKATLAGDMAKGGWSGAYSKNIPNNIYPNGIVAAVASNFDTEMSSQRGPMAISGTYEGARATAGSSAWWNLAGKKKNPDAVGGGTVSTNIETYGPTPGKPTTVRKGDDPYGRRSVAFTNNSPNSAAQSFAGNGPAAISAGYEVASSARSARDRKTPLDTIGHREAGSNGVLEDSSGGRRLLWVAARLFMHSSSLQQQQRQRLHQQPNAAANAAAAASRKSVVLE